MTGHPPRLRSGKAVNLLTIGIDFLAHAGSIVRVGETVRVQALRAASRRT